MPMLIPLVVAAGVKYYGEKQAAAGGQAATEAGLRQQAEDRKRAMGVIGGVTNAEANLSPDARTAQARQDFLDGVRSGTPQIAGGYTSVPGANPRYAEAVKAASDSATQQSTERANLMAGIRGQTRSREDVRQKFLDAGTNVSGINQDAGNDATAAGLAIQHASQVNPAYGIASQFLSNMAGAYKYGGAPQTEPNYNPGNMDETGMSYLQPVAKPNTTNLGSLFQ